MAKNMRARRMRMGLGMSLMTSDSLELPGDEAAEGCGWVDGLTARMPEGLAPPPASPPLAV